MINQVRLNVLDYLYGGKPLPDYQYMEIGLSTTQPNHDGSGFTEPSGNGYQRVVINNNKETWSNATTDNGIIKITNHIEIEFPISTGPWGEILYWGIFAAPTEQDTPELIWYGPLNLEDPYIDVDTIVRIPVGGIEIMAGSIRQFVPPVSPVKLFNADDYEEETVFLFPPGTTFGGEYDDMLYSISNDETVMPRIPIPPPDEPKQLQTLGDVCAVRNNYPLGGKFLYRVEFYSSGHTINVTLSNHRIVISDYDVNNVEIPVFLRIENWEAGRYYIRHYDGEDLISTWDASTNQWDSGQSTVQIAQRTAIEIIGSESGIKVRFIDLDNDVVITETSELEYEDSFGGQLSAQSDLWIYIGNYSVDLTYRSKYGLFNPSYVRKIYYEREGD